MGAPKAQIVVLISSSDKSNFSVLFPNYPVLQVNSQLRSTVRVSTSLNYPPSETGGYPPASRQGQQYWLVPVFKFSLGGVISVDSAGDIR